MLLTVYRIRTVEKEPSLTRQKSVIHEYYRNWPAKVQKPARVFHFQIENQELSNNLDGDEQTAHLLFAYGTGKVF